MHSKIRVLVADDNLSMCHGLARLVEAQTDMSAVGCCTTAAEAVAMALAEVPDVVLMDVEMPEFDGIEAARQILEALPATKVLMVSAHDRRDMIERALSTGASGYVGKQCSLTELPKAIRDVAEGRLYVCLASARSLQKENGAPWLASPWT